MAYDNSLVGPDLAARRLFDGRGSPSTTRIAADDREDFAGDVARAARRSEKHKSRCDLLGLRRPAHRRVTAECLDQLRRLVTVRISRCSSPLSPIALRVALIRLSRVESDTIRPPQTEAIRSSLLTTRSRFWIRYNSRSNTCGSRETSPESRRSSRRSESSIWFSKRNCTFAPADVFTVC